MRLTGGVLLFLGIAVLVLWRFRYIYTESRFKGLMFRCGLLFAGTGAALLVPHLVLLALIATVAICDSTWRLTRRLAGWQRDLVRGMVLGLTVGTIFAVPGWLWRLFITKPQAVHGYLEVVKRTRGAGEDFLLTAVFPTVLVFAVVALLSSLLQHGRSAKWFRVRVVACSLLVLILANFHVAGMWDLGRLFLDGRSGTLKYVYLSRPGYVRQIIHNRECPVHPMHFVLSSKHRSLSILMLRLGARHEGGMYCTWCSMHDDMSGDLLDRAIALNHFSSVKYLLEHGHSANRRWETGDDTPLYTAVYCRRAAIVDLLISAGAEVNAKTRDEQNPLFAIVGGSDSIAGRRAAIAKSLIRAGVDVNVKTPHGETPLLRTVCAEQLPKDERLTIARLLIENGADVNAVCRWKTALHHAAESGDIAMVRLLVENGADMQATDEDGRTPLHAMVSYGYEDHADLLATFRFLAVKGTINTFDNDGVTPLSDCIAEGKVELAKCLIECGAKLRDVEMHDPLHNCAGNKQRKLAELLLVKGVDVNSKDRWGRTPLHYAVSNGDLNMIKWLLAKGADLHSKDNDGCSVLLFDRYGSFDCFKYLVSEGIDLKVVDNNGETVLHKISGERNTEIFDYLLSEGLDPFAVDKDGDSLLHESASRGELKTVKRLVNMGLDIQSRNRAGETVLHRAVASGELDLIKFLISKGLDLNARTNDGRTAWHFAWSMTAVRLLISRGFKVDTYDKHGNTPLHIAVRSSNPGPPDTLLRSKANPNVQNLRGRTALHIAAENLHWYTVLLLMTKKADSDIKDKDGNTAYDLAVKAVEKKPRRKTCLKILRKALVEKEFRIFYSFPI